MSNFELGNFKNEINYTDFLKREARKSQQKEKQTEFPWASIFDSDSKAFIFCSSLDYRISGKLIGSLYSSSESAKYFSSSLLLVAFLREFFHQFIFYTLQAIHALWHT